MIVLSGAELVLPDRVLSPGTLVMDSGRIVDIRPGAVQTGPGFAFHGHYIVPGFVDVHVHGVEGVDSLQAGDAVSSIAARLTRYGVTAFCPTTVACSPEALRRVLEQVSRAREAPVPGAARVLPAHLESNFINPEYKGAQPATCLRSPRAALHAWAHVDAPVKERDPDGLPFEPVRILREIERAAPDVGIVTLAPELDGGLDLIAWLLSRGHRVSLGHSAATYDEAVSAIAAGARHATHLFNRMAPIAHRAPGVAGAVLAREEVCAELICDGYHVHPAMSRIAIAAKGPERIMAITDGTGGSGLPPGSTARLGGRRIRVTDTAAVLDDGTLAGSTLTMDRAFRTIVTTFGLSLVDAAMLCSTTPARELGLTGFGVLARDCVADVTVLGRGFGVVRTFIDGEEVYAADGARAR
jgi:N-acetylglucosamine-6-phosphate deacetylase